MLVSAGNCKQLQAIASNVSWFLATITDDFPWSSVLEFIWLVDWIVD